MPSLSLPIPGVGPQMTPCENAPIVEAERRRRNGRGSKIRIFRAVGERHRLYRGCVTDVWTATP